MEKLKTQKGKKDSKVRAEAEKIYRKYLQRGAVYEINLGPDVKRQIDKDIQGMARKFSSQSLAEFGGQNRRTKILSHQKKKLSTLCSLKKLKRRYFY